MEKMLKFGPKCIKGKIWDECGNSEIVQIILSFSDSDIKSIQFVYLLNGKICPSQVHGDPSGPKFCVISLDYPSEFLISVSGHTRSERFGSSKLVSLSFQTNKQNYGPFGSATGKTSSDDHCEFSYVFGPSFAGFYGSVCNGDLHAIGVYVRPVRSLSALNIKIDDRRFSRFRSLIGFKSCLLCCLLFVFVLEGLVQQRS